MGTEDIGSGIPLVLKNPVRDFRIGMNETNCDVKNIIKHVQKRKLSYNF